MRSLISLLIASCVLISPSLHAAEYRFSRIQVPNSDLTEADGINARGHIVGSYVDSDGISHSFLLRNGVFKTIDVPGAMETIAARGINARGDIVGGFLDFDFVRHGFLLSDGEFTQIDYPGSNGTYLTGINNAGDITGGYFKGDGSNGTFIRKDGKFYDVKIPGGFSANVRSAQDNGRVLVGSVLMAFDGGFHGFIRREPGEFELIDLPSLSVPCGGVRSINQRGDMVGAFAYLDSIDECYRPLHDRHGFLIQDGQLTLIDFPGSVVTDAFAINDDGVIVGHYIDKNGNTHLFKAKPKN